MESLKTILYFSIFRYPLTLIEIHGYTNHDSINETYEELNQLIELNIINKIDDFYIYNNDSDCISKRQKGNLEAEKIMEIAFKKARLISKFPYVKAVGISGSLSKGYFDKESDIDFFVITKPNKLWICRTILILYKKIFLLNSRKYFCVNYFITSNQLEIVEKNRFTATELKTLIPLQGKAIFEEFYSANKWVNDYFKQFNPNLSQTLENSSSIISTIIEFMLNNKIGQVFNVLFKKITIQKWNAKFKSLHKDDFNIALKSTDSISKHHPSNFQKKIILALNSKIEEVETNFNIILSKENA